LNTALISARSVSDRHREGHLLERYADVHRGKGNEPEAIACLEDALAIFTELGDVPCTKGVKEALEV
ncbi:MAG: hypothetical protein ACRD0P_11535, partial [Stackebrandtia sp.]